MSLLLKVVAEQAHPCDRLDESPYSPLVIPTVANPDFLPRSARQGRVCAFLLRKGAEVRQRHQGPQEIRGSGEEGPALANAHQQPGIDLTMASFELGLCNMVGHA